MDFVCTGRLEVRISQADVGKRVSVRCLTEPGDTGGKFTDTVGVLTSWNDGVLIITRRTGEAVPVAESTLVAGKVVPDAPARRRGPKASYGELAQVGVRAWQPAESVRLGGWLLRSAVHETRDASGAPVRHGFTRRANSALPLAVLDLPGAGPREPLAGTLAEVRSWYAERGLPAYVQAPTGAPGYTADGDPERAQQELCAGLEEDGWVREVSAEVRVAPLAPLDPGGVAAHRVRLTRDLEPGWLRRYHRSGGADGGPGSQVHAVLTAGPSVWFAVVGGEEAGGAPEAIGRCVVDGRWAGFMAVEVAPEARRQGLATAVMAALARQALDEGASAAWLQVEVENAGARALYDRMGFEVHHHYHHYRG